MASAASSSSSGDKKMLLLRSCDEEEFEVEAAVAGLSKTIRFMIEDGCADGPIPLHNVSGPILAKVLEYCKKHAAVASVGEDSSAEAAEDLKKWDEKYMDIDTNTLYDLILAANYLDIEELLHLTCKTVADMIKGKSPEVIRKMLDIKNDFTPEEEEEIRRENQWVFSPSENTR